MKAIIIEDDREQAAFIKAGLEREGFKCDCAFDGEDGYWMLRMGGYAFAIVDIMLPKMDGLEVIRRTRADGTSTPVIVLSQMGSTAQRIAGLDNGADDYLAKPFSMDELVARIHAVQRRLLPARGESPLVYEDLVVNPVSKSVMRRGHPIALAPLEYAILEYLLRNVGRTVSPRIIFERLWDMSATMNRNLVEVRICSLRKHLCEFGGRDLISTRRGLGYVLK